MRVYLVNADHQPTEIDIADLAGRFSAWLADDANPVLSEIICGWLRQSPRHGGLGAVAGTVYDLALLRAEVVASWAAGQQHAAAELRRGR
jgi:hypothetical protein